MADKSKKSKKNANTPKVELRSEEDEKKPSSEEVDEFVAGANRWGEKLRPHATKIVALVSLCVIAGLGWAYYNWQKGRSAMKATTAFSQAIDTARTVVTPPEDEPDPATEPDDGEEKEASFPDREARANATLAALAGSEKLTGADSLVRAQALMDLKNYDEAARAFGDAAAGLPDEAAVEARASIGYAYEAKAEETEDATERARLLNQALDSFAAMQPDAQGFRHDSSLFHQARILAVLGKRDEAVAAYNKLLETHAETPLKPAIEARLETLGAD